MRIHGGGLLLLSITRGIMLLGVGSIFFFQRVTSKDIWGRIRLFLYNCYLPVREN